MPSVALCPVIAPLSGDGPHGLRWQSRWLGPLSQDTFFRLYGVHHFVVVLLHKYSWVVAEFRAHNGGVREYAFRKQLMRHHPVFRMHLRQIKQPTAGSWLGAVYMVLTRSSHIGEGGGRCECTADGATDERGAQAQCGAARGAGTWQRFSIQERRERRAAGASAAAACIPVGAALPCFSLLLCLHVSINSHGGICLILRGVGRRRAVVGLPLTFSIEDSWL